MPTKETYSKPALSYRQQLDLLKSRGLTIEDEDKAMHLLANLSYYRFSAYLYPLLKEPKDNHQFKDDVTFNQAFKMYCFDRELKRLVFNELEKIEVSLRAKITYEYAHNESPFWYTNSDLFYNENKHEKTLAKINSSFNISNAEFAKAFKVKYSNISAPSWIALETCAFGSLSMLYSNLKPSRSRRIVADYYGLKDRVLISWLHSFVVVRNICAHHARLWNSVLNVSPKIPRTTSYKWINTTNVPNNKVYFILVMLRYMLFTINPKSTFKAKMATLFDKYPSISAFALGIPENAFQQEFWKD